MTSATEDWHPSRDAALRRLQEFVSLAGRSYASQRNFDRGMHRHLSVSRLSPWLRCRSIGEYEVVEEVLRQHSPSAAEKFFQEICWRTYWKGWLQTRPQVWDDYLKDVQHLYRDDEVMQKVNEQTQGGSGIDCFDDWCRELVATGYLHNHARMWFASIWIFTLKLPWQLGADFFMRHLLDGDPAANTLSWRWVGGLQTKGKTYLARADNIRKYTDGRYFPVGQLAGSAIPLIEDTTYQRQALPAVVSTMSNNSTGRVGLLITDDDLSPHDAVVASEVVSTVSISTAGQASPGVVALSVIEFRQALIDDRMISENAAMRLACHSSTDNDNAIDQLCDWAVSQRLTRVTCAFAPVGPNAGLLEALQQRLAVEGVELSQVCRSWDRQFWPHAGKGFFALKKKIPELLLPIRDVVSGQQSLF